QRRSPRGRCSRSLPWLAAETTAEPSLVTARRAVAERGHKGVVHRGAAARAAEPRWLRADRARVVEGVPDAAPCILSRGWAGGWSSCGPRVRRRFALPSWEDRPRASRAGIRTVADGTRFQVRGGGEGRQGTSGRYQ